MAQGSSVSDDISSPTDILRLCGSREALPIGQGSGLQKWGSALEPRPLPHREVGVSKGH